MKTRSEGALNYKESIIDEKNFTFNEEFKEGSYGSVYKVINKKTKEKLAAKVIKIENEEIKETINQEIGIMLNFQHPTIIKFKGFSISDIPNKVTIFMDLIEKGSLDGFLKRLRSGLLTESYDNTNRQIILIGIARGMMYLHQHQIIHRDLKPDNILLDNQLHPIIIDFGLSKFFGENDKLLKAKQYGTPVYLAPEILDDDDIHYNEMADVYSFGILMYEVVTDSIPYPDLQKREKTTYGFLKKIIEENNRPIFNPKMNIKKSIQNLAKKCWSKNPFERPSFEELFNKLAFSQKEKVDDEDGLFYLDDIDVEAVISYAESIKSDDGLAPLINKEIELKKKELKEVQKEHKQMDDRLKSALEENRKMKERLMSLQEENKKLRKKKHRGHSKEEKSEKTASDSKAYLETKEDKTKAAEKIVGKDDKKPIFETVIGKVRTPVIGDDYGTTKPEKKEDKKEESEEKEDKREKIETKKDKKEKTEVKEDKTPKPEVKEADVPLPTPKAEPVVPDEISDESVESVDIESITISAFNTYSMLSQDLIITKFIDGESLSSSIKFFKSLRSLLHYLTSSGLKCRHNLIEIYTNDANKLLKKVKNETQINIFSKCVEKLITNSKFEWSEFSNQITQFDNVLIELDYPSATLAKVYEPLFEMTKIKNKRIKIEIFITAVYSTDDKFKDNSNIYSIKLDSTVKQIIEKSFENCSSLTQIKMPNSVTFIGKNAFSGCSSLSQIQIPSSVTKIDSYAFDKCTSLKKVLFDDDCKLQTIETHTFGSCTSLYSIKIPSSVTKISSSAFVECKFLNSFEIPPNVTIIGASAFGKCHALRKIVIPSSVTSIGIYAFDECTSMTEVTIQSSKVLIRSNAFYKCKAIKKFLSCIDIDNNAIGIDEELEIQLIDPSLV